MVAGSLVTARGIIPEDNLSFFEVLVQLRNTENRVDMAVQLVTRA